MSEFDPFDPTPMLPHEPNDHISPNHTEHSVHVEVSAVTYEWTAEMITAEVPPVPDAPVEPTMADTAAAVPGAEDPKFGGYYNADGTYHYTSDNTDRDPETGAIIRRW